MIRDDRNIVDRTSKHIICFVALPFADKPTFAYHTVLLPALRKVLESKPYYWQVARADDRYFSGTIYENVAVWMRQASVYIADISDLNPNVLLELGYMYWGRQTEQPLIVLERSDAPQNLTDLQGVIRIRYIAERGSHAVDDVAKSLEDEFKKRQDIQILNIGERLHYLSASVLMSDARVTEKDAPILSKKYETMENFISIPPKNIARQISGLNVQMVKAYQQEIKKLLDEALNQ